MSVHADLFTAFIQRHLPAAINMGIEVVAYDGDTLQCRAPLSLNYNDKLTAFGGSLYVLCVLTCWGMVYLRTRERGLDGDLVVSKGEIEYRAPVAGEFFSAVCDAPAMPDASLNCHGYGSVVTVTAAFGLVAADATLHSILRGLKISG